jgi:hypothetical protein
MASVASTAETQRYPTNLAALPGLLAYAQGLGLDRWLARPKRGVPALGLALVWLVLAWRGSGRPHHLRLLAEPLLGALLGRARPPCGRTLARSVHAFSAHGLRRAVEAAYQASLPGRAGQVWVALDAHQLPYWGRGQTARFLKGWSGGRSRRLRGYRLYLAVDTGTGQVITYLLGRGRQREAALLAVLARRTRQVLGRRLAGVVADCGFTSRASVAALTATRIPFILGFARSRPIRARLAALRPAQRAWLRRGGAVHLGPCPWDARLRLFALGARTGGDRRGPWVYLTSLRAAGPQRLARLYRQRWRVEQALDELLHGHDLDHLVSYRLHANRVAVGFRLLARTLALGYQLAHNPAPAAPLCEPLAFRARFVDGLGAFTLEPQTIRLAPWAGPDPPTCVLPWTGLTVLSAA